MIMWILTLSDGADADFIAVVSGTLLSSNKGKGKAIPVTCRGGP
jgi:hypothetical protein